ncbi:MAG: IgGFc-binding protein [Deltaproteobacteria bacterium]|nr:IgGFc-binding protein [Deltaproteobacteria bacterium]
MSFLRGLFLVSLVGACTDGPARFVMMPTGDGGSMDAAGDGGTAGCAAGRWSCQGPQQAVRCDERGEVVATERCTGTSRCVGGAVACAACTPGSVRCSPEDNEAPELCAPDGASWQRRRTCDVASGEHCLDGQCRRPCGGSAENSYLGCEYWATPTANSGLDYRFAFAVVLANPGRSEAHLTVTGGRLGSAVTRTVAPGAVERVELPWIDILKGSSPACHPLPLGLECQARSAYGQPAMRAGAYRITSDVPLAAYQFNPLEYRTGMGSGLTFSFSADASLLLPQNVLGDPRNQEYLVLARPNFGGNPLRPPYGGFVAIVGGGPEGAPLDVVVETTAAVGDPSNRLRALPPGRHSFPLARGAVLQLVGTGEGGDLTGTSVRANGPIAVFSGNDCVNVPVDRPACDHLEEQLMPLATWGRRYAVTFLRERAADPEEPSVVRILSQADGNRLTFDGIAAPTSCGGTLDRGRFCEFTTNQNFIVSGERPILVGQFMVGLGSLPQCRVMPGVPPADNDECVGDPAMVLEAPTEQYRSRYELLIPSTYRVNYVNLVSPRGADFTLDGEALNPENVRGPFPVGASLEVRVLRVDAGAHTLATRGAEPFGAKVYGVAAFTSYMYSGGLNLQAINPPG